MILPKAFSPHSNAISLINNYKGNFAAGFSSNVVSIRYSSIVAMAIFSTHLYAEPIMQPTNMPSYNEGNSDLVNKGAYIARAADCMGCHGENYGGGTPIEAPMGKIYSTNITPSIHYGIGNYTQQDFKDALVNGKTPSHHLYPAMPYPSYSALTDEDIHAMFEYFKTIPPIDKAPEHKTDLAFPFNIRPIMIGYNLLNMPNWTINTSLTQAQQRGQYLVNNLEHCGTCHTPRNVMMGYDMDRYLSGAMIGHWHAPNLTPDDNSGLGLWSEEEIVTYLRYGQVESKALAAGPMNEVITHSTKYLTDSDLQAIASYLKAIPVIATEDTIQPLNTANLPQKNSDDITINLIEQIDHIEQAKSQATSEPEKLYLNHCASCHGADGYGQPDADYASIIGLTLLRRDNPAAVVNVIAHGIKQVPPTHSRMPGFKEDLSAAQIADITNYIRLNFGGVEQSSVTADEVTSILKETSTPPFLIKYAPWLAILGIIIGLALVFFILRWLLRRNRK